MDWWPESKRNGKVAEASTFPWPVSFIQEGDGVRAVADPEAKRPPGLPTRREHTASPLPPVPVVSVAPTAVAAVAFGVGFSRSILGQGPTRLGALRTEDSELHSHILRYFVSQASYPLSHKLNALLTEPRGGRRRKNPHPRFASASASLL